MKDKHMNIRNIFLLSIFLLPAVINASQDAGKDLPEEINTEDCFKKNPAGEDVPIIMSAQQAIDKLEQLADSNRPIEVVLQNGIHFDVTAKRKKNPNSEVHSAHASEDKESENINNLGNEKPHTPSRVSKVFSHCKTQVYNNISTIFEVAKRNPKSAAFSAGTAIGATALYAYKTSPKVKKYVSKKYEDTKEKANDRYYDILDEYVMPLVCEWKDWEDEDLTWKNVICVGAGAGALYGLHKANKKYEVTQTIINKLAEHTPFVKKHIGHYKQLGTEFAYKQYQENKNTVHAIGATVGILAATYLFCKSILNADESYSKLLAEFWETMSDEQQSIIQNDYLELITNAQDNPIVLFTSQEFMDMLSEEQQILLEKIALQYTKESAHIKEMNK